MKQYDHCPHEGCTVRGLAHYIDRHATEPHRRCSCGWVGSAHNHVRHIAQLRRHQGSGFNPDDHVPQAVP